jgi:hypothetical protein
LYGWENYAPREVVEIQRLSVPGLEDRQIGLCEFSGPLLVGFERIGQLPHNWNRRSASACFWLGNCAIPHGTPTLGLGERRIRNMIHLLEEHGVRIFSLAVNTRTVDAFSLWKDERPFVFLISWTSDWSLGPILNKPRG